MVRQSGSASSADLFSVDLGDGKLRRAFLCPKREPDLVRVIGRLRCCRPLSSVRDAVRGTTSSSNHNPSCRCGRCATAVGLPRTPA